MSFQVGDVVVKWCIDLGSGRSYDFAKVAKITPTGRLRVAFLCTQRIDEKKDRHGSEYIVRPILNEFTGRDKLVNKNDQDDWKKYDPKKKYQCSVDFMC